jgi:hypothetical protein
MRQRKILLNVVGLFYNQKEKRQKIKLKFKKTKSDFFYIKIETIDEILENTRRIQDNTIFHDIRQVIETGGCYAKCQKERRRRISKFFTIMAAGFAAGGPAVVENGAISFQIVLLDG